MEKDYKDNKEILKQKRALYYQKHKEYIKAKSDAYYKKNREKMCAYQKSYRQRNKEKIADYKKEYAIKNSDKISAYKKKYANENKTHLNEYAKNYQRERRERDVIHKFKMQVRHLIWMAFNRKGQMKSIKTEEILGCKMNTFIEHLLKTFIDRYGYAYDFKEKVHIDHIKPLSNAKSKEDILQLCNYKNLQLLKESDNLHKGTKDNDEFFAKNFN